MLATPKLYMVHGWASGTKNAPRTGESMDTTCDLMGRSVDVANNKLKAIGEELMGH